jgi:cytochrome P450
MVRPGEDDMPERVPIVDFDHHSALVAANPANIYTELRNTTPVFWSENYGGYWVFTKYAHLAEILTNPDKFSSARRDDAGGPGSSVSIPKRPSREQYPLELDPPRSTAYRKVLNPLMSPAAAERMRPGIHDRVHWCIDQIIERGSCDLVSELTSAVPSSFTADWLGLPHDIWPMLAETMHNVSSRAQSDPLWSEAVVNMQKMYAAIESAVARRRAQPADDVISVIVASDIDGEPITDEAAVSVTALLVAGGVDTTTSLTSQALVWLSENREQHDHLLADRKFLRSACEEFLRYFSPNQALGRTMNGEAEIGGCPIHDGDRLLVGFASANWDEEAFPDADRLILDRFPNRHMAFGLGVHRCVGSNVARVIFDEVITGVLSRLPDYTVDVSRLEHYHSQGLMSGWKTAPATFTPGPRIGAPLDVHAFRVTAGKTSG